MSQQKFIPMSKEDLAAIKPGDIIERMLGFAIPLHLRVSKVEDNIITASLWEFDRNTGLEIDDQITMTVSYIKRVVPEEEADQEKIIE